MMSFSSELVNLNSLHLIDGSDPQLLGIQAALEGAGFATVLIQPGHGLQDVVDVLKQGHPKLGFDSIHIYGHGRSGEQDFGHDLITPGNSWENWHHPMQICFSTGAMSARDQKEQLCSTH